MSYYFLQVKASNLVYYSVVLILANIWMLAWADGFFNAHRYNHPRFIVAAILPLFLYFFIPFVHDILAAALCEALFVIAAIPIIFATIASLVAYLLYWVMIVFINVLIIVFYLPKMLLIQILSWIWSLVSQLAGLIWSFVYSGIEFLASYAISLLYIALTHELFWIITLLVVAYIGCNYYCKNQSKAQKKAKLPREKKT